jgi:hypothetical protein
MNPVETLQARLRADLKTAMRDRHDLEVRTLRSLLEAIDDAQAVPVGDDHEAYVVRAVGDPGVEVPRISLTLVFLEALRRHARQERFNSAEQMATIGQADRATSLLAEANGVERFLARD